MGGAGDLDRDDEPLEDGIRVEEVKWTTRTLFRNRPSALQRILDKVY